MAASCCEDIEHKLTLLQGTSKTSAIPMPNDVCNEHTFQVYLNKISKLPLRQSEAPLIAGDDCSEVVGLRCCCIKANTPIWAFP